MAQSVVAYIRVSTDEQAKHGFSIPAQQKVLSDYAAGHDLRVVREFTESESASHPGRPQFREMIDFLKKRKGQVTGVLCYKIDRLSRNLQEFAELDEMQGVAIISATEHLPPGSSGRLVGGIQAVFARHYSDQLGERTSLGMKTKAEKGLWPSAAPLGYSNDRDTKGITPNPKTSPLIQQLFEFYASGTKSLREAGQFADEIGLLGTRGGRLDVGQVHRILTNPIYYGSFVWRGTTYSGAHVPLISEQLYRQVQRNLQAKHGPQEDRTFPFRGLLTCGYCGCKITATLAKKRYPYYHCTHGRGACAQPYTSQKNLSQALGAVVASVGLTEEQVSFLLSLMAKDFAGQTSERKERLAKLQRERSLLEARRNQAYTDKLDGRITEERWLRLDEEWSETQDKLDNQIALLTKVVEPRRDDAKATFELLQRAPELYHAQDDAGRAAMLQSLVSNCLLKGDTIVPIYRKPFDLVAIGHQTDDWYPGQESNL